jgi:hypothetical protein
MTTSSTTDHRVRARSEQFELSVDLTADGVFLAIELMLLILDYTTMITGCVDTLLLRYPANSGAQLLRLSACDCMIAQARVDATVSVMQPCVHFNAPERDMRVMPQGRPARERRAGHTARHLGTTLDP